ncbi:MAG: hypothetical protein ACLTQL_08405 [Eisenbergiella sp.]
MKIKCSRCGKRFDADMYSGLCPKCGAYNGKHMAGYEEKEAGQKAAETAWQPETVWQSETEPQPERAWQPETDSAAKEEPRQETFGESTAAESRDSQKAWQSAPQAKEEKPYAGSQSFAPGSADRYRTPEPAGQSAGNGGKGAGKMLLAAILIPIAAGIAFQFWEKGYFQERMTAGENIIQEAGNAQVTVLEGGSIEYPVYVGVIGTGPMPQEEVPEGWHLEGVCVAAACEGYNSEEQIEDIQIGYKIGDETFYQKALDKYELEQFLDDWGLEEDALLASYDFDYDESLGYFVFMVRDGAADRELILEIADGAGRSVTRQSALPLEEADGVLRWENWAEWNGFPEESGVEE